jgi:hypothetical protein
LSFYARVSILRKGYVALLKAPLTQETLQAIVEHWLNRFDVVEQVKDGGRQIATFPIRHPHDVVWEDHPQLRVVAGEQFAWVYFSADRRIIETDGLVPVSGEALSLHVLALPECEKVVSDKDDRTLDQWEKEGLM